MTLTELARPLVLPVGAVAATVAIGPVHTALLIVSLVFVVHSVPRLKDVYRAA